MIEHPSRRFQGRVALVTGAGRGIGHATAWRFAAEGAAIGVLDRDAESAASTARDIRSQGGRSIDLVCDVSDTAAVEQALRKLVAEFGTVDVLVNNAGFDRPGAFLKVDPDDFKAVWSVHLLGAVNCCRSCGPIMIENGRGSIVNVSSIYGRVGSRSEAAYSSAKAALIGLTKSLAQEWGNRGVRVNAILPGLTDTPAIRDLMAPKIKEKIIADTALKRAAEPGEIAAAIAFLASDDAAFVTGAALEVTGGWNL